MVLALLLAVGDLEKLGDVLLEYVADALFLDQQRQALVNPMQGLIRLAQLGVGDIEQAVGRGLFPA